MQQFKLGKLPARHTLRTMRQAFAMAATLDPLGEPPAMCSNYLRAVENIPCQMYGNDLCGDCVEVDTAYGVTIRTANASTATVIPKLEDVLSLYKVFGFVPAVGANAGNDPGTDELSMCQYLKNVGFLEHRLNNYATVDPANINHLKWSIELFGGCRIGWMLPDFAEQQFRDNKPWDVRPGTPNIVGGHDTRLVHYEGDMFYTATWGRWKQPVTRAFVNMFCEEAHPELAFDWINEQGVAPSDFDLADLEAKLQEAAA